jgi:hypothetical protein
MPRHENGERCLIAIADKTLQQFGIAAHLRGGWSGQSMNVSKQRSGIGHDELPNHEGDRCFPS